MTAYQGLSTDISLKLIEERLADKRQITSLGGCVFAGGFSLGLEDAGIQVAGHLELSDLKLGSFQAQQRWPVHISDTETWKTITDRLKQKDLVPDIVHSNPPCAAYASTGSHQGTSDDRMRFLRACTHGLALRLQPKIFVWELVPGILKDRAWLDSMAFHCKMHGYRSYGFLTSAALHGGYQDRKRFHFIASRYHLDFERVWASDIPEHTGVKTLGRALALANGNPYNNESMYMGAFKALMPFCMPGTHLRDIPPSIMAMRYRPTNDRPWKPGDGLPGFSHIRGRLDKPSPSILGGYTVIHPTEDRYLTPRECATVMGFPGDFKFTGGPVTAYSEIGRGLCTHTASFLGRVFVDGLTNGIRTVPAVANGSWMTVIDWRKRSDCTSMKPTADEHRKWWADKHETLPAEWQR